MEDIREPPVIPQRQIKHLVVSGGSIWGFTGFGILFEAIECGFLNMADIESVYATSAGTIIATMLILKINHHILFDYLLKRPWETVCKQNKYSVLEIYDAKGLFHKGVIENIFSPLFKSVDLTTDITLQELYEWSKVDLHIYTTELNEFKSVDISHSTHPHWRVLDAIYASCSIPLVFSPLIIENECYLDGGIFVNYPIENCLAKVENVHEIFGISLGNSKINEETIQYANVTSTSNIFDIITTVFNKMLQKHVFQKQPHTVEIPYQIRCLQNTTAELFMTSLYDRGFRQSLLNDGIDRMKHACKTWFIHC
jgi:NTE family protein|uniref:PNPLA domain-containing protein n=1 Tax=viral metagenome TaxID=1070528 RepID=A0A6C0DWV9_9ZZZZ